MQIEINEEEREFLERICTRAELFVTMNLFRGNPSSPLVLEKDLTAVRSLKDKFRALDANLINKVIKSDH